MSESILNTFYQSIKRVLLNPFMTFVFFRYKQFFAVSFEIGLHLYDVLEAIVPRTTLNLSDIEVFDILVRQNAKFGITRNDDLCLN